ncbi:MAG TPA: hypothetical protein VFI74_02215 [Candidatus Saccharimonadales bacterium]|nr:hypothetical protein [Candidatus Saccharimonadales bacterium]
MDFMGRNNQQQPGRVATPGVPQAPVANHHDSNNDSFNDKPKKRFGFDSSPKWLRIINVAFLFSIAILALSVAMFLWSFNPNESKYVATDKYQAVFLNNGQVYFGKLRVVTAKYYDLQNIFYLNTQSSSSSSSQATTEQSSNSFVLKKLGCEVHGPSDEMVINRDQVTFWENLKDDGQVVKTISEWYKQNPNGQKCDDTSGSTTQSTSNTSGTSSTSSDTSSTSTTTKSGQ